MKRSELLEKIEGHLSQHQQVADEAAEGLKFLRLCYIELKKPAMGDTDVLQQELASADSAIKDQQDKISDYEDILYDLLLQADLVPDVDGSPAISLGVALKEDPDSIEKLKTQLVETPKSDSDRFIAAVRQVLDADAGATLQEVYDLLESKAEYLSGLEQGIAERDNKIQNLETIMDNALNAAGQDWQNVDEFPLLIAQLMRSVSERASPITVADDDHPFPPQDYALWVQDAIDLAHAVCGNMSPENRIMAKAARELIIMAPKDDE